MRSAPGEKGLLGEESLRDAEGGNGEKLLCFCAVNTERTGCFSLCSGAGMTSSLVLSLYVCVYRKKLGEK